VSIDGEGNLRIDRGYVRPEDEPAVEPVEADGGDAWTATESNPSIQGAVITVGSDDPAEPQREGEEDDALKPLSERLISELTALKSPNAFHDLICPMRNLRALSIARENTSVAVPI